MFQVQFITLALSFSLEVVFFKKILFLIVSFSYHDPDGLYQGLNKSNYIIKLCMFCMICILYLKMTYKNSL